jgi:hypothetical protein
MIKGSFAFNFRMPLPRTKKLAVAAAAALLVVAALLLARYFSPSSDLSGRQQLLQLIPADATSVLFLDLDQFRESPFLAKLYSWASQPTEDSEYAQFVRDTGFSYERDLKRVVFALSNQGAGTNFLAVADGKFDRKKIESFLVRNGRVTQQGKWKVFLLNQTASDKQLSVAFLSDNRIAIGDFDQFLGALSAAPSNPFHSEWNERFERLAGTPLFAVIRQDPAIQTALDAAAPGGFRSPQLSALLDQLQWISIAGKPEGDYLRLVSEGESRSESATSQLRDLLQGMVLLAQNGLNDAKLRQQMNQEQRQAYLEILKSADVQKIDRGQWKSVRVVLAITPKFLEVARISSLSSPTEQTRTPQQAPKQKAAPNKSKAQTKK